MSQLFAHPVLAPWLSDYLQPASFGVATGESVPADLSSDQISVPIRYELQCTTLESIISTGCASFAVLVTSPRTMIRELYMHRGESARGAMVLLRMSDFAHNITLTPYITSTEETVLRVTDEHDVEFHEAGRTQFTLPSGAILAIGDGVRLSNDPGHVTSIIDIVASRRVATGEFFLDYDDTRIKVLVNPGDQRALRTMRTGSAIARAALYPGLYLHAVVGAISNLSDHRDSAWAHVVSSALESQGIGVLDDDRLVDDAHIHAQKLLEAPFGHLLGEFSKALDDN